GLPLKGKLAVVNSADRKARGTADYNFKLFAPRAGFAYRVARQTVVRGGYGIFYLPNDLTFNLSPHNHPVNSLITPWIATLDGGVTAVATLSNPFPNGVVPPPGHDPSFQSVLYGQSLSSPVVGQPFAYVQQWNFNIQREILGGTAVEIAYAGSKGT